MNIKPTFTQDSQSCPGVRFTMRVLNQITRAERDAELVEARASTAELAAQMQRLPDPDEPIRRINAAAQAESRERTPEEQAQIQAIEAQPDTVTHRVARNKLDQRIGLTINRDLKPAYIRASLISIEGFEVDGQPAMAKPWESLLRSAPDELIDELYVAANLNSGLTTDQEITRSRPRLHPKWRMSQDLDGNSPVLVVQQGVDRRQMLFEPYIYNAATHRNHRAEV
ncbi:MAG: hypothetical protein P4K98_07040 [Bryobacteraceae bacterium]|nr:hypothetical protein [Bryobacteraceae bacterium]